MTNAHSVAAVTAASAKAYLASSEPEALAPQYLSSAVARR